MKQLIRERKSLNEYNQTRLLASDIVDGKTYRRMRRKNKWL